MSRAAVEKLERLLKRVQERSAAPRLRAVEAPRELTESQTVSSVPPEPETLPPAAALPAAPASVPGLGSAPTLENLAPAPEPARKAASITPLEAAMEQLPTGSDLDEGSGPLQVSALAQPITMETRVRPPQDLAVTERPGADEAAPPPIELTQPARPKAHREATIAFETEQPETTQRELRPVGEPPAPSAPTQVIEPQAPVDAAPARVVAEARIETPKSFGELLDLSLSLRPR